MTSMAIDRFVGAIDQGTSSTKFVIYDHMGQTVALHQLEHKQHYPNPGYVEHDPQEIWGNTQVCIEKALQQAGIERDQLEAVGITNQRESVVIWDRHTGKPYYNVIVWNDTRTTSICEELKKEGGIDRFRDKTGLPLTPYFSASKILWLLENVPGVREAAEKGDAIFGTIDTWLVYQLTDGKVHITDVSNASRTLLMNIRTLTWDDSILTALKIPKSMLPEIKSSCEVYCEATGVLQGVKIAGLLGDQQSALFGQACFEAGQAKATYGTGAFLLMNTGRTLVPSQLGLLTTVAFKLGDHPAIYALEGSVAYCGSVIQWLRDNLGIIKSPAESEKIARQVSNNGGMFFVPAFAGLFAPYWRDDARGVIVGMTAFNTASHVVRAALESAAFQVREVLEAMQKDSGVTLKLLKVDGGMTANSLLMQFQADLLDVPVLTPQTAETTSLGAASAAGLAVGYWKNFEELREIWSVGTKWDPYMPRKTRLFLIEGWSKAVTKSFGWLERGEEEKKAPVRRGRRDVMVDDDLAVAGLTPTLVPSVLVGGVCLAIGFLVGSRWSHK